MKTTASLKLRLESADARKSLIQVLAPDNRDLPRGLGLAVHGAGKTAEFEISSPSPSTSLSTVLALLRDAALFQEVWLLSHNRGGRGHRD